MRADGKSEEMSTDDREALPIIPKLLGFSTKSENRSTIEIMKVHQKDFNQEIFEFLNCQIGYWASYVVSDFMNFVSRWRQLAGLNLKVFVKLQTVKAFIIYLYSAFS